MNSNQINIQKIHVHKKHQSPQLNYIHKQEKHIKLKQCRWREEYNICRMEMVFKAYTYIEEKLDPNSINKL